MDPSLTRRTSDDTGRARPAFQGMWSGVVAACAEQPQRLLYDITKGTSPDLRATSPWEPMAEGAQAITAVAYRGQQNRVLGGDAGTMNSPFSSNADGIVDEGP